MADSVTLIYRGIVIEDLMQSSTLAQTTAPVLNLGTVSVTPFLSAASDAAAAAAGAILGDVYINTSVTPNRLRSALGSYSAFTPTLSTGTMTTSGVSFVVAQSANQGANLFVQLQFTATFGGTAQGFIQVTGLPASVVGLQFTPINAMVNSSTYGQQSLIANVLGNYIYIQPLAGGNFSLGVAYQFYLSGFYRIA